MTKSRGAKRQALRGLVGALMVVGAALAVIAANMGLLLYADGRDARTGQPDSRADFRPATGVAAREPAGRAYAREAPGRLSADPAPRATQRPRPGTHLVAADRESRSSMSQAEQNGGEQTRGSIVQVEQQGLDTERPEPDRAREEAKTAPTREAREEDPALERQQQELEAEPTRAGKGVERPAATAPPGEHDDD